MSELQRLLKELMVEMLAQDDLRSLVAQTVDKARPVPEKNAPIAEVPAQRAIALEQGLLSERMVKSYSDRGCQVLNLGRKVVVTPLAREALRNAAITIRQDNRR